MSKKFTLTKKEFIKRSMKGEVFINSIHKYFYDDTFENPFRISDSGMDVSWEMFDSKTLFTLKEPKKEPKELLWYWSLQDQEGDWSISNYMFTESDVKDMTENYTRLDTLGSKNEI